MPTPSDHIDMMIRTKATAFATIVIWAYISIKSTVHPPSKLKIVWSGRAGPAGRAHLDLLQREVHRDRHDDRNGSSVEQRGSERPLFHRIQRRSVEQRDRTKDLGFSDATIRS